ncbi:C2 domain-containing protein 3, partial [Borealophlyctis nickersoniae]
MPLSPTAIPTPAPPPSLPPKVVGPIRSILSFTISKLVWTNPPSPDRNQSSSNSQPRVRVSWWGDDGSPTVFSPLSVGQRTRGPPGSGSSIPVRGGKSAATPAGRTTLQFPVRCTKKQLMAYFRDMGSLELLVVAGAKIIGRAVVKDLSCLAGEPSKPINGFFPVMAESGNVRKSGLSSKGTKLGELHLSMVLDDANGMSEDTRPKNANANITEKENRIEARPVNQTSSSNVDDSPLRDRPRDPPDPPKRKPVLPTAEEDPFRSPFSLSERDPDPLATGAKLPPRRTDPELTSPSHVQETAANNFRAEGERLNAATSTLGAEEPEQSAQRPKMQSELQKTTEESERRQPMTQTGNSPPSWANDDHTSSQPAPTPALVSDIVTRAQRLKQAMVESIRETERIRRGEDIPDLDVNREDALAAFGNDTDPTILQTATKGISGTYLDSDDESIRVPDIDDSKTSTEMSDMLEDDLIIEALNSGFGKQLIGRRQYNEDEPDTNDANGWERDDDGVASDDDENESNDERRRRALEQMRRVQPPGRRDRQGDAHPSRSFFAAALERVKSVRSIRVSIERLEIPSDALSSLTGSFIVEYGLPGIEGQGKATSKGLPRFLAGAGRSRTSTCVVKFEYQEVWSYRFNEELLDRWLNGNISFTVTASVGRTTRSVLLKGAKQKEGWIAKALVHGRNIIEPEGLKFRAKVPVWSADDGGFEGGTKGKGRIPGPSLTSKRDVEMGGKQIGQLSLTFELLAGTRERRPPVVDGAEQEATISASRPASISAADASRMLVQDGKPLAEPASTKTPPPPSLSGTIPHYLHLRVTKARALSILPALGDASTLLYLSTRLFSSSSPPIETPPIPYRAPFDIRSGRINDPIDFGFEYTLPVAVTEELGDDKKDKPIIFEVWAVATGIDPLPLHPGSIPGERVESGPKMLGLLRLPYSHLLATVVKGLKSSVGGHTGEDMPVMIPEADYPIADPFSGTSKGWVKAFMALGTWEQISRVRKREEEVGRVWSADDVSRSLAERKEFDELRTQAALKEGDRSTNAQRKAEVEVPSRMDSEEIASIQSDVEKSVGHESVDVPAECSIEVTVHRACGLKALLNTAAAAVHRSGTKARRRHGTRPSSPQHQPDYTPLDYAREVGANCYIRFRLFPRSVARIISDRGFGHFEDEDETLDEDDAATVVTPIVAQSFAPKFEHAVAMTIRGVDSDLIRWMRGGGEARGQ